MGTRTAMHIISTSLTLKYMKDLFFQIGMTKDKH
jgi:hypothetical protein